MKMVKRRKLLCLRLLSLLFFAGATAPSLSAQHLTVGVSGNTITWSTPAGFCCGGATLDDPGLSFFTASCSVVSNCSTAPGASGQFACNRVGDHLVTGCWGNTGGANTCESQLVTVSDPPPPTCPAFTLVAKGTSVLTHKYQSSDTYPTGQTRDAQMELVFRPISVATGTTIYFKVFDPPDTSRYGGTHNPDDNHDTAGGKVSTSPSSGGAKTAEIVAPATGTVSLYLNTTDFAAGDNYEVAGSADPTIQTDPNFVCSSSAGCRKTSAITVWKRVYLEKKRMFRSGALIVGTATAGQNQVTVQITRGVRFSPGDKIRLVHSPNLDGTGFRTFYSEDAIIAPHGVDRVSRTRRLLTLTAPLQHTYGEDPSLPTGLADGLSDGVGILSTGFYTRNEAYISGTFADAFIEYGTVPQANTDIPFLRTISRPLHVANKWFENSPTFVSGSRPGDSNVKHVLAGSGSPDANGRIDNGTLGETVPSGPFTPFAFPNASWTFVQAIENAVRDHGSTVSGLDPLIVNGENCVHELAHAWSVNYATFVGTNRGHCAQMMALRPAEFCTVNPSSEGHNGDGIVGFHWVSDSDSEYMSIRWQTEPVPAP